MKESMQNQKKKKIIYWKYPLQVLILTLALSFVLNISSETILSNMGLIVSFIILFIFIGISILFDMIGVSVTAGNLDPFLCRASKNEKGAKIAIKLIKNAEKVSSFCCDIVGDSCGILSGAVGASIVVKICLKSGDFTSILIATLFSSIITSITVFGKAVFKTIAVNKSEQIILKVGKFLSFFSFNKLKKNKKIKN